METESSRIRETIDLVTERAGYVECVLDRPKDKRDLRDELGVSRSTVYKAVRELEAHRVLERTAGGHQPTLKGRLLYEEYRRFHAATEAVCRSGPLLDHLPADLDLTADLLDGATIDLAERHAPQQPVRVIEDVVREATVLKGTSPVVLPQYVDIFHERFVAGDLRAELVFERPVVEHLVAEYSSQFDDAFRTGALTLREIDDVLSFGLAVVEAPTERVLLIVYGPSGELKGVLTNDTPAAIEWGRAIWDDCWADATRPDLGDQHRSSDDPSTRPGETDMV